MTEVTLDILPRNQIATITQVDWAALDEREARRLRELGFDAGAQVEALHKGGLISRDPLAIRIGRMTVAIRVAHAAAMTVSPA